MPRSNPKITEFLRDVVLHSFEAVATHVEPLEEGKEPTGLQRLAADWRALSDAEREQFIGHVTSGPEIVAAAVPIALAVAKSRVRNAAAKRVTKRVIRKPAALVAPVVETVLDQAAGKKKKKKDKKGKKKNKKKKKGKKK